jgi:branched-chain amino acid transport system permease protein
MSSVLLPAILGIAEGLILTLISLGLVLTYGMMRIVNMAHGSFFMLCAFVLASVLGLPGLRATTLGIAIAVVCACVVCAVVGVALERTVYARMYDRSHVSGLLGTFALALVFQGVIQQVWGLSPQKVLEPTSLVAGHVSILGTVLPDYYLLMIAAAIVALAATSAILLRTNLGLWTRAIAADRQMAGALGANVRRIFALMFALGCILAAIAGSLMAPVVSVDPSLAGTYIVEAFAVVLIGGLGSIRGCVVAALLLGLVDAFCAVDFPALAGYDLYIAMLLVLLWRPQGLFGYAGGHSE